MREEGLDERERDKGKEKAGDRIRKIFFWNVARVGNKDRDFWKYIENFDMVNLCETWIEEKGWEGLRERLSVRTSGCVVLREEGGVGEGQKEVS